MSEKLSRRDFLKLAGAAGGAAVLAACGVNPANAPSAEPQIKTPEPDKSPEPKVAYNSVLTETEVDADFKAQIESKRITNPELSNEVVQTFTVNSFDETGRELTVEFGGYYEKGVPVLFYNGGDKQAHPMTTVSYLDAEKPTWNLTDEFGKTVFSSPSVLKEGEKLEVTYTPPTLLLPALADWDGKAMILSETESKLNFFYARKAESPALDPEAWNQYGNVLVKNEDIKPFGKQLVVNPEFSGQFGETVFTFCNQVSYLAALADEFSKSGEDSPPAPTGDLKDFETYKASVIQPAINNGQTIEGSHLVAHDKYANKQPGMGMVEPIPNFNPAKCVIKIDGSQQIYPNSLMIDAGSYQIGMDTISLPDGNVVRRLLVNVALTRPKYEVFSANDNTSANENAVAFSQMLNVASANITKIVNEIPSNKSVRDSFVMGPTGGNKSAFSYATTQQAGIDFILEHMANAPAFFIPSTP